MSGRPRLIRRLKLVGDLIQASASREVWAATLARFAVVDRLLAAGRGDEVLRAKTWKDLES